jgi:hypothetical protein
MRTTALAAFCLLGACHLTRLPQDNFTLRAGSGGIQLFVAGLEHAFGRPATTVRLNFPDSDPSQMFEIEGHGVTITLNPVPDDRCNPSAPMHSTYKQGEYRIDVVYETNSIEKRKVAKRLLLATASDAGLAVVPFKEC